MRHACTIGVPPERVWAAMHAFTPAETPLARILFRLRGLPVVRDRPVLEQMLPLGFTVIAEEPPRELVLGAVGTPWRPAGGLRPYESADPGTVGMRLSFRVEPHDGGTLLATETTVEPLDAAARRAFAHYWLVVRPGSGAVRRSWLRAIRRRAEASASSVGR